MVGQIGLAGSAAYAATKAAMSALAHAWAAESSGVGVSAVAPGPVYRGIQPREATAALGSTLLNRAAEPEPVTHPPARKYRTR